MTQHVLNPQNYKPDNMFQLQWAIIRPKTEQSPGTSNDCAHYEIPFSVQF